MDKVSRFILTVESSNLTLSKVADSLGITLHELIIKIVNNLDFLSQEMVILSEILHLENPYNFFYN